ncbi:MAPEG family protein [Waterburya agarophytonicola K14]|uniref:MAPEG family protein n=1 Tax=Waterburya agarophytonicola KI4 TaxID=2874699 RepID=A0A964FEE7_9CYAN|nr:MAPEG family protein [Waterburya agarophytonicola]MCC0176006.1 MAPEG family protein [Waterburya agarophytonicola KI4]
MKLSVDIILLCSVVGAVILVYAPFLVVGWGRLQAGYDQSAPRAMFDKLPPYAQRATWAHQNSFEALTIYGLAALMAYATGVDSDWGRNAAIAFLVARLFYSVFYIANIPVGRSLMFAIGSLSAWTLFGLSILQISH